MKLIITPAPERRSALRLKLEAWALFRRVFDGEGNQLGDEFITENHAVMMYSPMLVEMHGP